MKERKSEEGCAFQTSFQKYTSIFAFHTDLLWLRMQKGFCFLHCIFFDFWFRASALVAAKRAVAAAVAVEVLVLVQVNAAAAAAPVRRREAGTTVVVVRVVLLFTVAGGARAVVLAAVLAADTRVREALGAALALIGAVAVLPRLLARGAVLWLLGVLGLLGALAVRVRKITVLALARAVCNRLVANVALGLDNRRARHRRCRCLDGLAVGGGHLERKEGIA